MPSPFVNPEEAGIPIPPYARKIFHVTTPYDIYIFSSIGGPGLTITAQSRSLGFNIPAQRLFDRLLDGGGFAFEEYMTWNIFYLHLKSSLFRFTLPRSPGLETGRGAPSSLFWLGGAETRDRASRGILGACRAFLIRVFSGEAPERTPCPAGISYRSILEPPIGPKERRRFR